MFCIQFLSVGRGQVLQKLRTSGDLRMTIYRCLAKNGARSLSVESKLRTLPFSNSTTWIAPGHKIYRISQEPTRNFSSSSSLGCSQSPSENYGSLVYQGTATSLVKGVKFFSLSTSLLTLGLLPVLFNHNGSLALNYIGGIFATIIFITPVLLHTISRTYVTRLYYNSKKDTYSAFTFTLFLRDRLTKFTPNDVQVPGITNLFTTFTVNGKALLVDPSAFSNPNDYNHLMGYDKHEQLNPEEIIKKIEESRKENQK